MITYIIPSTYPFAYLAPVYQIDLHRYCLCTTEQALHHLRSERSSETLLAFRRYLAGVGRLPLTGNLFLTLEGEIRSKRMALVRRRLLNLSTLAEERRIADAGPNGDPAHFTKIDIAVDIRKKAALQGRTLENGTLTLWEKQNIQEARGELNAFYAIDLNTLGLQSQNYRQIHSFGKDGIHGIDDVFEDAEGNLLIVEAKGGNGDVGNTKDGRQMSYEWMISKARMLGAPVGEKILDALTGRKVRVQGVILRTPQGSGSAVITETRPSQLEGIEDVDLDSGIINYSATFARRNPVL